MEQLDEVETVVATRFHTVLCALRLGKSTLAVGYAAKFDALMAEMGLAEFSLPAKSIDRRRPDRPVQRVGGEARPSAPNGPAERNAANERLLDEQFAELSVALFDRSAASRRCRHPRQPWCVETVMDEVLYAKDFWSDENLKYVEPHFRMLKLARIVTRLAEGRTPTLLDIGCGPATLRRLIPSTVEVPRHRHRHP